MDPRRLLSPNDRGRLVPPGARDGGILPFHDARHCATEAVGTFLLRLLDADMLPPVEAADPYQRRHQLSDKRDFDDGKAMLNELRALARARCEEGRGIDP
ncbi:MAG: hypothetical protein HQL96_11990 [Magnetococcales bacterium]|nr:hypothetical protein [Magnetococcales bacterium]